jgi:pimeloyl-ACP methyl ester carboxylesterase
MNDEPRDATVVLIPGLWMPAAVMLLMQRRLERAGLRCRRFGYPSARAGLEDNSARLAGFVRGLRSSDVYLVGHSLGGVVALHATATHALSEVRRIVMVGSPYRDSYVARRLGRLRVGRWMLGKTVPAWLDGARPGLEDVAIGVVAGTSAIGIGMLVAPGLARPHDGVIRTEETQMSGMADYAEVPACHMGLLVSRKVGQLVAKFLCHGRFERADAAEAVREAKKGYALGSGRER